MISAFPRAIGFESSLGLHDGSTNHGGGSEGRLDSVFLGVEYDVGKALGGFRVSAAVVNGSTAVSNGQTLLGLSHRVIAHHLKKSKTPWHP